MTPTERNDILEIRETLQELIVLVAKQGECQRNFVESQGKSNADIKEMIRTQKEDTRNEIATLKSDHCERLNKHSEKIEKQGNDLSEIKGSSKTISFLVSTIVSIIGIIAGMFFRR